MFSATFSQGSNRLPTILIVDADADTRLLYRTVLAPLTSSLLEADNGVEALEIAMLIQPALVVLETRLHGLDGLQLCAHLRANPLTRGARQLVVTADTRDISLTRAQRAGVDGVLAKPCWPETLFAEAARMMRVQRDGPR